MDEVVNRVANSKVKTIDLEDFYPSGKRVVFDMSDWLFEGLILKEKDFREYVDSHDWSQYTDCYVAIKSITDAIIPSWAYLVLTTRLAPVANKVVVGSLEMLETVVFKDIINGLDVLEFENQTVIIKGCSNKPIPLSAYSFLIDKIQFVARKVMFGESCSNVPLFKKNRKHD